MQMSEKEAKDYLQKFSIQKDKYFKPPRNTTVTVQYLKMEVVSNHFDKARETPRYHLLVNGDLQYWDRPNKDLAAKMSTIRYGSWISILAVGYKKDTRYDIQVVNK